MSEQKDELLKAATAGEVFKIDAIGYAIRSFQEDNVKRASWAYTVGLKKDGQPYCLFSRAGVNASILDYVLCEVAEAVRDNGPIVGIFNIPDFHVDKEETIRVNMALNQFTLESVEELKESLGNFVEGQEPNTIYYMVMMADKANRLPGEEGYVDFMQLSDEDVSITEEGQET